MKRHAAESLQAYNVALYDACRAGDTEAVRRALGCGADPNLAERYHTPLSAAIYGAYSPECVRLLLEAGADPNECEDFGHDDYRDWHYEAALDYLITFPFDEPIDRMSKPHAFSHEDYRASAEERGAAFREILTLLEAHGAVEDFYAEEECVWHEPDPENTRLLAAIRARDVARAESLLIQGAEVQCYSNRGYSALTLAARYGQLPMVQLLLDYGAAVDEPCIMRDAARSGNLDILRELLPFLRGRYRSRELSLALYPAAARGRVDILQFLIDNGADVNHRQSVVDDTYHRALTYTLTPLLYTIINNQRAAHDLLIAAGATYTPICI